MTINNVEFWKPVIGYEKLLIGVYKYKWKRGELV